MTTPKELANLFCEGKYICDLDGTVWHDAFELLASHADASFSNTTKMHLLWTVNGGHIRKKLRDDALLLSVLKRCLPTYKGEGLWLYRGECNFLYEEKKIGFCWTPDIKVAEKFARGLNAIESGGVLLKAYAPTSAILAAPNDHSSKRMQEFEYTCDPWQLKNISVIKTFQKFNTE